MSEQLPNSGLFGNFVGNEQDWGDRVNANWFILDQMAAPAIDVSITSANDSNVVQVPGTPHLMIADNADHGQIWIFTNTSTAGGATTNAFIRISPMPGRQIVFQGVPLIWDTTSTPGRWRPESQLGAVVIATGTVSIDCERVNKVLVDLQAAATINFENYRRAQVLDFVVKANNFGLSAPQLEDHGFAQADGVYRLAFLEHATTNPAAPYLILG